MISYRQADLSDRLKTKPLEIMGNIRSDDKGDLFWATMSFVGEEQQSIESKIEKVILSHDDFRKKDARIAGRATSYRSLTFDSAQEVQENLEQVLDGIRNIDEVVSAGMVLQGADLRFIIRVNYR